MSRSKTPNPGQGGSYDQNLLVDAPQASRAQLREGYDVDLLEGGRPQRSRSVRSPAGSTTPAPPAATPPLPLHQGPLVLAATENGSKEQFVESGGAHASKPRTGFWRSRKGIITVVVIILVVIGAVVGGAVGGTTKKAPARNGTSPTPSSSGGSTGENPLLSSITTTTASSTSTGDSNPAVSGATAGEHSPLSTESAQ